MSVAPLPDAASFSVAPPAARGSVRGGAVATTLAWLIRRLRIFVAVLPLTILCMVLRWLWEEHGGVKFAPFDATVVPPVVTATALVMSITMSSVMADFKESEKIPAEMVGYLQTLLGFALTNARVRGFDPLPGVRAVESMLHAVLAQLDGSQPFVDVTAALLAAELELGSYLVANGVHELETVEHAATEMRKKLCRVHDIGRMSIVLPAYTMVDYLTVMMGAVLINAKYYEEHSSYGTIVVFVQAFGMLNLLIRDLDDPYHYPAGYCRACYDAGAALPFSLYDTVFTSTHVDFGCLTVDMGANLRRAIVAAEKVSAALREGGAGEGAPAGGSGHGAPGAHGAHGAPGAGHALKKQGLHFFSSRSLVGHAAGTLHAAGT